MKFLHYLAFILVVVGGLNWGLVGIWDFNLVDKIFGNWAMVERIVYILVGLSAVYLAVEHKSACNYCSKPVGQAQV
jgi:uncharacterized membrane protein YuzA (DUF378 family)